MLAPRDPLPTQEKPLSLLDTVPQVNLARSPLHCSSNPSRTLFLSVPAAQPTPAPDDVLTGARLLTETRVRVAAADRPASQSSAYHRSRMHTTRKLHAGRAGLDGRKMPSRPPSRTIAGDGITSKPEVRLPRVHHHLCTLPQQCQRACWPRCARSSGCIIAQLLQTRACWPGCYSQLPCWQQSHSGASLSTTPDQNPHHQPAQLPLE